MFQQAIDTNPEIERIRIQLLKEAGPQKRFSITASLISTVINLSKRAIARANPGLNKRELDLLFVKYNYGIELEKRLRKYLELKDNGEI